jgi:DNA-directed RNA polymerase subunit RPC12/RpoP
MREKKYLRCASCGRRYNVSCRTDYGERVYICQDCGERELAKIQKRRPAFVYGPDELATVIYKEKEE